MSMTEHRPQDGRNPDGALDALRAHYPLFHLADFAEPPEGGGGGGGEDDPPDNPPDNDDQDDLVAKYKAEAERARKEAAKYRVSAKGKTEAEKRAADLEAKLEKYEQDNLSEIEKAQKAAEKAAEKAAALEAELAKKDQAILHSERLRIVSPMVTGKAAQEFAASQLAEAQAAADEPEKFDTKEWLTKWLEDNPAFAGGNGGERLNTGGGHPPGKSSPEITKIKAKIKELDDKPYQTTEDRAEASSLRQQLKRLEAKRATA